MERRRVRAAPACFGRQVVLAVVGLALADSLEAFRASLVATSAAGRMAGDLLSAEQRFQALTGGALASVNRLLASAKRPQLELLTEEAWRQR